MISICFKSLNKKTIIDLESLLEKLNIDNVIYVQRKFSSYFNLIVHFKGKNANKFYEDISDLFSNYIINYHENRLVKSQMRLDFFYFSSDEQKEILDLINKKLNNTDIYNKKISILNKDFLSNLINTKKIYIDGIINFRLSDYKKYLNTLLEKEIHEYVINKEYTQYIDLLKSYIIEKSNDTEKTSDPIHLLYSDTEKIILDKSYNTITTTYGKKYLSDISFSENDFILNSILSLMPQRIIIHTNDKNDNFIIFLQKIFENKINFCEDCKICKNKKIYTIK